MTLVNTETGELVEPLTEGDAERLSSRISLRLDTIADNYTAVLPLIREAIERQAHVALGYRSPGEYAADRFGDALSKLGPEMRQAVVRELADLGMSTRAIAPVVGVSQKTVVKDTQVIPEVSPPDLEDEARAAEYDRARGYDRPREERSQEARAITGIDGKQYTRPAPIDHAARADAAIDEFPDLAYYRDEATDLEHCWRLAEKLREYRERGELDERLDILRRSIALDRSKRDGTYVPATTTASSGPDHCPTCGQTIQE